MDLRTGEINRLNNDNLENFKHLVEINEEDMTKKQKEDMKVSLKDNKSKLGKLLKSKRKELGYSQMSRNQRRNLRKKLLKRKVT